MAHSHSNFNNPEATDEYQYKSEAPEIDPAILSKLKKTKLGKVGNYIVYQVDDQYIRDCIDVDFVLAGNFARYPYVPEDEIWVSDLTKPSDYGPTLVHEAIETYLMTKYYLDYEKAHNIANIFESRFRRQVRSKELKIKNNKDAFKEANRLVKEFLMDAVVRIK
jgi:hypothetical protein